MSEAIYGFWRWEDETSVTTSKVEEIINLCLELGIKNKYESRRLVRNL